ncbi:MAG: hypothetical protein OEY86_17830, partial [Nitrospira sp.]|nr:hypothetical protein [Nitrospira sp.]
MTTELKRFTEAYATMTVAAYEPLLLRWISQSCIRFLSNEVAYRLPKARAVKYDGKAPAALALSKTIREPIPLNSKLRFHDDAEMRVPIDIHGRPIHTSNVKKVVLSGYPNAVAIGNDVYLNGITTTDPEQLFVETKGCCMPGESAAARILSNVSSRLGMVAQRIKTIPLTISSRLGRQQPGFDFTLARDTVEKNLIQAVQDWVKDPNGKDEDLVKLMIRATNVDGVQLPHLWPSKYEGLSPIGIAHYFRQLYFNKEEGVGPIEEAFTVAPLETLEVIYQTVRKQSHEEILEQGLEVVSEAAVEEKNLDEVSDKVSSMVQQDISASMSANASGSIGVWQVGASASANIGVSSQRSREYSTRRLKEVTKRASERITKSFSIKVKDTTEVTETTTTRRVIRNESASPVSYGLRRVLRRVNVKVQDLGPRLVWQVYLRNPGNGLARSRFVHFHESGPITAPDIPPGTPPRPSGGTETGSVSANLKVDQSLRINFVTIVVRPGADRVVTGLRIDSITDLDGGGKNDRAPAARNDFDLGSTWDPTTHTFTANIGVWMGNSMSLQVSYTYTWEPSDSVLEDWETQRAAAVAKFTEEAMTKKFERDKALITEKSKVKSRPASDLRREERYEMMNRMVNYLFGRGDDPSEPT